MYLSDFARFWRSEMNSLQCPPYPKKITDLPSQARILLENPEGGVLCQNMFSNPSALCGDTLFRFQNEQFVPYEIKHFERAATADNQNNRTDISTYNELALVSATATSTTGS